MEVALFVAIGVLALIGLCVVGYFLFGIIALINFALKQK